MKRRISVLLAATLVVLVLPAASGTASAGPKAEPICSAVPCIDSPTGVHS